MIFREDPNSPSLIYPFGATLNVKKPSVVILSTGEVAYPVKRPLASFYKGEKNGNIISRILLLLHYEYWNNYEYIGKLVVFGSGHFFDDQYIDQECNEHMREVVMNFLTSTSEIQLHPVDADDPDVKISNYEYSNNNEIFYQWISRPKTDQSL